MVEDIDQSSAVVQSHSDIALRTDQTSEFRQDSREFDYITYLLITRLGCARSNTNKTVCNSLLELMTVSAQLGFNSSGFNNSMHCYLQKKSIHPQPVLMKWDTAIGEAAFYKFHRLTRFHKRGPFDMTHVIV
ncbi:hypothetical protein CAPTEDRAFT_188710 [Capitella teleta]|uniref:Uncharacterized protein n=1 Tax=Capitella teleta TaxID=283909 RepID=R7T653_CAPTE|nr:hypothetical protein CAPTEDRAFT_188710 [Capitella teleta]|eukprot:ELT88999.1 hypothetical protein CAPTEDRAFT_188710 [Capitella teleta]